MINIPEPPIFYGPGDALPPEVCAQIPPAFLARFGSDPGFVGLGPALSRSVAVLRTRFAPPRLSVEWINAELAICSLRFRSDDGDVWGQIHSRDTHELYWGRLHAHDGRESELSPDDELRALPRPFLSYYAWLDGVQRVAPGDMPAFHWRDLPCASAGRVELSDLFAAAGLPPRTGAKIYRDFRSRGLRVFLQCSTGDIVFADEYNRAGTLFHLHREAPEVVSTVIGDDFLDTYVAYVLEHGDSGGFPFVSWMGPFAHRRRTWFR